MGGVPIVSKMSEDTSPKTNILYVPGVPFRAPTPGYNRLPLPLWNPIELMFGYSDNTYFTERTKALAIHGALIGLLPGTFLGALKNQLTDNKITISSKKNMYFLMSMKYGTVGALSGVSFLGSVRLMSELRNGKDDWINHYIGGFFLMLPSAIYNSSLRMLTLGGLNMGLMTALFKVLYVDRHILFRYDWTSDPDADMKVTNCRYPEMYISNIPTRLGKDEERRRALEYQNF